jgi:hypothetical protein
VETQTSIHQEMKEGGCGYLGHLRKYIDARVGRGGGKTQREIWAAIGDKRGVGGGVQLSIGECRNLCIP